MRRDMLVRFKNHARAFYGNSRTLTLKIERSARLRITLQGVAVFDRKTSYSEKSQKLQLVFGMMFMRSLNDTRSLTPRFLAVLGTILFLIMASTPSHGAQKFWTGTQNGNFNNAGNWSPSGTPAAGADLIFPTGVTQLLVTNDFSPNRGFTSISFQGSNYFVRGNPLLLTNGILSLNPVGPNHIDADVEVRASQTWEGTGPLASIDVNGDINLNANTLTVRANTADFFFSGIVSGSGNLVKTNVGTLRLDGAGANTYSGFTRFEGGILELNKGGISIPGDLTVGDGNGLLATDVLRLLSNNQIADTADVTVKNSGLMDFNGFDETLGPLTLIGGAIDTEGGTLTLAANVTTQDNTNTATINGNLSLSGSTRTFNVNSGSALFDLRINAVIQGLGGIIKTGGGTLSLAGTNTYSGVTTINEGQIALLNDRALGATVGLFGSPAGTVVNSNANLFLSSVQVTNEDLTINSANPGGAFNASGASIWTGDILLNSATFIASSGSLLLNGAITGTGGFTKLSGGSLTLSGTNQNTYSGTTTVRDGTLLLDKNFTSGAMSGPLIIGEDELPENTDIVQYLHGSQLPDDTDITINASGLLDLNGFGENVRNLIFNGGDIDTGAAGSILPTGDITVNGNANSIAVISGRLSVLSNPIINVTGHNLSPDLQITAQLHGAGGFIKNGPGEVALSGANTFSGAVTNNAGVIFVDDSSALGTTAGGTVVKSGAALVLRLNANVGDESLILAGNGAGSFGALSADAGSSSWAGDITLSANTTMLVDTGSSLNLSGAITNILFDVTKTGGGTLIFSGGTANSFDDLFVNTGTLRLNKSIANAAGPAEVTIGDGSGTDILRLDLDNQIADTTKIHINPGGRFDLNDQNETTGAIDGSGVIDLGSGILREGVDDDSSTFSGLIVGTGSLFKLGTGTWTLAGDNSYTGQTTISAGTLIVNGSQPQSPVTVNGTALLGGSGVVGNLQVFGSVTPGASPGILTSSNVNFASQADYFVELAGPDPGTGYDQLNVRGTNNLGDSTLHVSVGAGFAPFDGQQFVILNNDGSEAIVGTFAGLPNGSIISASGLQFRIRYSAIFENDVVLAFTNSTARLVSATVSSGNLDGNVDINECNQLSIVISNISGASVSGALSATLIPKTPGVSVTVGNSSYSTMPAGTQRTNNTPFQFSTGPAFVCGTNLDFDLILVTPANGTFTIPFSLPSGTIASTPHRLDNNTVVAIPNNSSINSTVTVSGVTTPIQRVTVFVHILHASDADLDISLIGPDGTTVVLSSDNGGTGDNYGTNCVDTGRTIFNDLASTSITAGSAPFVGSFRPEEPLSTFNGKIGSAVNGVWTLHVVDDAAGSSGSLQCWSLNIFDTVCTVGGGACESCPENRTIRGTLGNGSQVQTNMLFRNGIASVCGTHKVCPGNGGVANRLYDAYVFENGEFSGCISVNLSAECNLFSAAYTNAYDPLNICQNYLADMGVSLGSAGGNGSYQFNVGPRARFVIVVNGVSAGLGCEYKLTVTGGNCTPWLNITKAGGNQVDLDWSTAAVGYLLEHTNALPSSPQSIWPAAPGTPTISGGRFHVLDNMVPTNNFYRLRKP